ncbi:DUF63 family protein [archaeon]|nr:DUF63 family protein [archaeon]
MKQWLLDEFWYPLFMDGSYTTGETLIYAAIFIFFVFLAFKIFKKLDVKFNKSFYLGWTLWIVAMASVRVLEDYSILTSRLFITPYIDFIFGGTAISLIVLFKYLDKKKIVSFNRAWIASPLIILIPALAYIPFRNFNGVLIVFGLVIVSHVVLELIGKNKKLQTLLSKENKTILLSHLLDASATFTAIAFFGAYEKHVLPSFLINIFGPWIMFPLKLIVVGFVLYYLDKEQTDAYETKYIKLFIFSLGIGTGLRGILQILGY